jgi:lysophospholipase L1-like esterase
MTLPGAITSARSGDPAVSPGRAAQSATTSTALEPLVPTEDTRTRPTVQDGSVSIPTKPRIEVPGVDPIVIRRAGPGSTVVFLGDSYTSGWQGAGIGSHGWAQIVGRERGWRVLNFAVPGTGYLNPGWTGQPIGSLVGRALARHPDVVVVEGGHNDFRWSSSATAAAAARVIARLHRALPTAVLVVIGPIWQDGSPPVTSVALRDRLRRLAAAVGAVFVDPIGARWFAGSRHWMIRADGIHPSDAGHRWMAGQVLAALSRNGV